MPTNAQKRASKARHFLGRSRRQDRPAQRPETEWSDRHRAAAEAKRERRQRRNLALAFVEFGQPRYRPNVDRLGRLVPTHPWKRSR